MGTRLQFPIPGTVVLLQMHTGSYSNTTMQMGTRLQFPIPGTVVLLQMHTGSYSSTTMCQENFVSPIPEQPTPLVGDCNTILYMVRVLCDRDGSNNLPASTKLLTSKEKFCACWDIVRAIAIAKYFYRTQNVSGDNRLIY